MYHMVQTHGGARCHKAATAMYDISCSPYLGGCSQGHGEEDVLTVFTVIN